MRGEIVSKPKPFVLVEPGQTPITAPELVAKLQQGARPGDLAKWLEISESRLRRFLKDAGYAPKAQPSQWVSTTGESVSDADEIKGAGA